MVLAILLMTASGNTAACQASEQFNVQFEESSDRLTGNEAGRFGSWVMDMQKKYPNRPFFLLISNQDEKHPNEEIAKSRGAWVKSFLIQMGEDPKAIVYGGTSVWRAKDVGPDSSARPTSLSVEFNPGCPNRCCTGTAPSKNGRI